jgi:hypothetical protein
MQPSAPSGKPMVVRETAPGLARGGQGDAGTVRNCEGPAQVPDPGHATILD